MSNFFSWIKGAVDFLSKFLTADRLALVGSIIKIILTALRKVDEMSELSDEAKRATAFGLLTEEQQRGIINLVQDCLSTNGGEVFEFELDQLPPKKCRELENYVKKCLSVN
jgi:hypothetical protein